ncbi:MAG: glycosyltransferase [Acidobacteria bacterium]|nr:glycosyltransferase [Acidobacteriota bacterium]
MNQTTDWPLLTQHLVELDRPLVSVVIACYNQGRYLRDAIESALAQTHPNLEILVVDDGSTDETAQVARAFPRVGYIRQDNRGLPAARNTGLRESAGRYLVFLDADDRLLPHAVQSGLDCFRRYPDSGFVFGAYRNIHDDGTPAPTDSIPNVERDHYWRLLQGNFIGMHATVMYSRQVLEAAEGFDERLRACEDYELYLRLARSCKIRQHGSLVAEYRQHDANMSRDYEFMLKSVLAVLRMQEPWLPDLRLRQALRSGIRVWREYYGALLVEQWKGQRSLRGLLRLLLCYPSGVLRRIAKSLWRRFLGTGRIRFGSLRRLDPVCDRFGLGRGQPIDRRYIESFLAMHADSVSGRVLEIGDDAYSRRFGGDRVIRQDILHVLPGLPGITIVADLANAPHIPLNTFDCIILTQTLHYIYDLRAAVRTLERILKPGGVLLATLPGISRICRDQLDPESDCWRFTASSARRLFAECLPAADLRVNTYGNVLAAAAFLYGLASHELSPHELDHHDPDYPVIVAVAAKKREFG